MRRTCVFRTCARVLRQIFSIGDTRPKGGKLKLMRNGFTAGFGHFWDKNKFGEKNNIDKIK